MVRLWTNCPGRNGHRPFFRAACYTPQNAFLSRPECDILHIEHDPQHSSGPVTVPDPRATQQPIPVIPQEYDMTVPARTVRSGGWFAHRPIGAKIGAVV